MERYEKIVRSKRTLNRWLRKIEDEGLLRRTRRISGKGEFGFIFRSTIYVITRKGYELLKKMGFSVWSVLKKTLSKQKGWNGKNEKTGFKDKNGQELMTFAQYKAGKS